MATTLEPSTGDTAELYVGDVVPARSRFRPDAGGWVARAAVVIGLVAIALLYIFGNKAFRSDDPLAAGVVIAVGALSLNVLVGYAGQISLGQQAFIGIGAFTSAYVISQSHQSFYAGVAAGAVAGRAQAVVLEVVTLGVLGLYFAMVALGWGAGRGASTWWPRTSPSPRSPSPTSSWRSSAGYDDAAASWSSPSCSCSQVTGCPSSPATSGSPTSRSAPGSSSRRSRACWPSSRSS